MTVERVKIYFDGGSRGNPGPAAGAAYADFEGGRERSCFIASATNNEAEYRGLLMGIELAKELKLSHVTFLGDSKLVVMQVSGQWKAKHKTMQQLKLEVLAALSSLPHWSIEWLRRESNSEADRVANETMDRHLGVEKILLPDLEIAPLTIEVPPAPGENRPPVRADIHKLNQLGAKASFADFRSLKVGGMDAYSRASLSALSEMIPKFEELNEAFIARLKADRNTKALSDQEMDKLHINALRWSARGLLGELAVKKVLVDLEVSNNIRGKKK